MAEAHSQKKIEVRRPQANTWITHQQQVAAAVSARPQQQNKSTSKFTKKQSVLRDVFNLGSTTDVFHGSM